MAGRPSTLHLLRGSPCVRSWSRYQKTVPEWTLCGVHLHGDRTPATEYPLRVSCPDCRKLMGEPAKTPAAQGENSQERSAAGG